MNARDIVVLVCEKKAPAPYWTHTKGIYADLSDWPHHIDYYVKCPECGNVHGFYKSLADAHGKRLCPSCDFDKIEKLKKEVAKVTEARRRIPPAVPPVPPPPPPEDDPDLIVNPHAELERNLTGDWVQMAKLDLERQTGIDFEISDRNDDPDLDPETTDAFYLEGDGEEWKVWKTQEIAEKEAIESEVSRLEDEPSIYMEFLQRFIDEDKLREALTPDEDNMNREYFDDEYPDYEAQVEFLVKEGKLEESTFYDEEGNMLEETPELARLVSDAADVWVSEITADHLSDPVQYLRDLGYEDNPQKNPYTGEKPDSLGDFLERYGAINYQEAAEELVRSDGWAGSVSSYDNKAVDLRNGAVATRER